MNGPIHRIDGILYQFMYKEIIDKAMLPPSTKFHLDGFISKIITQNTLKNLFKDCSNQRISMPWSDSHNIQILIRALGPFRSTT